MNDIMAQHADADAVLHLAAQVAVTTSVADPRADFEIERSGHVQRPGGGPGRRPRPAGVSLRLDEQGLRLPRQSPRRPATTAGTPTEDLPRGVGECEPLDFHSPYGCSKGAGDQYVLDYARIYGMKTVSFRQSCIYGTRQFGVEDQGWVAWFCIAALTGQPLTIYGDGKQVRDTLWVGDLVECYERALERIDAVRGQAFNIGGGPANTLSLLELVERIERRLGDRLEPAFADWRPGDQRVFVADIDKAERLLGWSPRVGVTEGLDRLLAWVDDHRFLFSNTGARTSSQTSTSHGDSRGKQPDRLSASPSQFSPSVDGPFPSHNDIRLDEIAQR